MAELGTPPDLSAVGSIRGPHGVRATAFFVSQCEPLTVKHAAGHVKTPMGLRMHFNRPGIDRTATRGTVIAEGSHDLVNDWLGADRRGDWMLIRLDRCIGRSRDVVDVNLVSLKGPTEATSMQSAGFPVTRAWTEGVSRDPPCRVGRIDKGLYRNDYSTLPGDSGGPLFVIDVRSPERPLKVYAMQAGSGDQWSKVQPWNPARANIAIDTAAIAPLIEPPLTRRSQQHAGAQRDRTDDAKNKSDGARPGATVITR